MSWKTDIEKKKLNEFGEFEVRKREVKIRDGTVIGVETTWITPEAFLEMYPTKTKFKKDFKKHGHEQIEENLKKDKVL